MKKTYEAPKVTTYDKDKFDPEGHHSHGHAFGRLRLCVVPVSPPWSSDHDGRD